MDSYNYDYTYHTSAGTGDTAAAVAVFMGFLFFFFIFALISYVVTAWLLGRIFKKAGVEQWVVWVPVYNTWKLLEIGGQQGFWAVLSLVPIVNIVSAVFMYIAMYHIGKKLGKEDWFIVIAIFLPLVWLIWLAFDDSKWAGAKVAASSKKSATKAA